MDIHFLVCTQFSCKNHSRNIIFIDEVVYKKQWIIINNLYLKENHNTMLSLIQYNSLTNNEIFSKNGTFHNLFK